jgi:hypothetical protein
MIAHHRESVVRIYGVNNRIIGAGFLVTERAVATCAHVIEAALKPSVDKVPVLGARVNFDFPLLKSTSILSGEVFLWQPFTPGGGDDFAVMNIDGNLPSGARAARLVGMDATSLWGHKFRALGFPSTHVSGVWAYGKLLDTVASGWLQIESKSNIGYSVQPGFSGTPVWDEKEKGVVGMIVAAEKQLDIRAAFVIPTGMLVEIWPDLSSVVHKRTELADVFQRRRIDNRADRTSKRAFEKTKRLLTSRSNGAELLRLLSALENEVGEGPHASIQTIGELLDEFQRIDKVVYEQLLKEILSDASNVAESARSTVRARLQGIRAVRR